jgi:hypothetical protein
MLYYLAPRPFLGTRAIALDEANKERNSMEFYGNSFRTSYSAEIAKG